MPAPSSGQRQSSIRSATVSSTAMRYSCEEPSPPRARARAGVSQATILLPSNSSVAPTPRRERCIRRVPGQSRLMRDEGLRRRHWHRQPDDALPQDGMRRSTALTACRRLRCSRTVRQQKDSKEPGSASISGVCVTRFGSAAVAARNDPMDRERCSQRFGIRMRGSSELGRLPERHCIAPLLNVTSKGGTCDAYGIMTGPTVSTTFP